MPERSFHVGIVGAGVAGCSAAYFLRQEFASDIEITVYEREPSAGGRILTTMFAGAEVELGASFIHSTNLLLDSLIDSLALERRPSVHAGASAQFTLGIWNGTRFVLRLPASGPMKYARLALRYGLPLASLRRTAKNVLAQWEQIYASQPERCFATPKEMFESVDLLHATSERADDFLARRHVSPLVRNEFCSAVLRAIFTQTLNVNAFAGVAGLVASGIAGGTTFSVAGGNQRLCMALLKASGAETRFTRGVTAIHTTPDGGITVVDESGASTTFDAVIVATPLESARIALHLETPQSDLFSGEEWQSVTETCIAGEVAPEYFGLAPSSSMPDLVLTTDVTEIPFSAITPVTPALGSSQNIYKISSTRPLEKGLLNDLFRRIDEVSSITWRAYPRMNPKADTIPFTLAKGLYYVNSMETIVSTLETEVLASRNAVRLMKRDCPFANRAEAISGECPTSQEKKLEH